MKKAFSLIELSIVILIIGIIIAGVTQSSRLLGNAKIIAAQNLTQSSPVASIEGLLVWFEPTLPESFPSDQAEEGQLITQWNDINPQSSNKLYAISATNNQFYSKTGGPGELPSIFFDNIVNGGGTVILLAKPTDTPDKIVGFKDPKQTFFFVYKSAMIGWYIGYSDGWGFPISSGQPYKFYENSGSSLFSEGTASSNAEIASITLGSNLKLYVNGSNVASTFRGAISSNGFGFGGSLGYISEIIVFNRVLKDEERQSIEQYLGKKYGIKVATTATPAP